MHRSLFAHFGPEHSYPNGAADRRWFEKLDVVGLIERRASVGRSVRYFSLHVPAWVAAEVAPDFLTVTIVREPTARTISHLRQIARSGAGTGSLEEIYEQPAYRRRLANYQTRIFSQTKEQFEAIQASVAACTAALGSDPVAHPEAVADALPFLATVIERPKPQTDADLHAAKKRLDVIDEVGITDALDDLFARVERRCACRLKALQHDNAASEELGAPASLIERIQADNAYDAELYEHARSIAAATREL